MKHEVHITIYTAGARTLINISGKRLVTTARDGVYYSKDSMGNVGLCADIVKMSMGLSHVEQNTRPLEHFVAHLCGASHLCRMAEQHVKKRKYWVRFDSGEVLVREYRRGEYR